MTPYFAFFAFFMVGAMLRPPVESAPRGGDVLLFAGAILMLLFVGLRYQVGGDWINYVHLLHSTAQRDFQETLALSDPGFMFLNWLTQQVGGTILMVNVLCAIPFVWGLFRFARSQPDPWLVVIVAIPYLTVVVAMGYIRQAAAIGIIMAGLASYFGNRSLLRFVAYILVATLFHKTAVLFLPIVVFAAKRNRLMNVIGGLGAAYLIYSSLLTGASDNLLRNYVESQYNSQGAAIRVAMDVVPALLFLLRSSAFGFDTEEKAVWRNCSILTMLFVAMLFVLPSTVTDRLALYVIPLQLAVLPRVPGIYLSARGGRVLIIGYSLGILAAWLVFAANASSWLPYQFYGPA